MMELVESMDSLIAHNKARPDTKCGCSERLLSKKTNPHIFGRLHCSKCQVVIGPHLRMLECPKCSNFAYCSQRCLEADANEHKQTCDPVAFYTSVDGDEIALSSEQLQYIRAERASIGKVCANCDLRAANTSLKKCSRCKQVVYCSKECQATHWPIHKRVCEPNSPRSAPATTRSRVCVISTTQLPSQFRRDGSMMCKLNYIGPNGDIQTTVADPRITSVFQLDKSAVETIIKIQGNEGSLINRNTELQFYNEDRSVDGWIHADMNATGEHALAYNLICQRILQSRNAGRMAGKKAYFQAVVQRDMKVMVNLEELIQDIEW